MHATTSTSLANSWPTPVVTAQLAFVCGPPVVTRVSGLMHWHWHAKVYSFIIVIS